MTTAIKRFKDSLRDHHIDQSVIDEIVKGYEKVSDNSSKERKVQFFVRAMKVMDELLDYQSRYEVRDACACCRGGWREKAVKKLAEEYKDRTLEEKLQALWKVRYMGNPILNDDGTITGGIGGEGGCDCPCPIFYAQKPEETVSKTYCLCCAGHFRYHYQIALGKKLRTKAVLSTGLESMGKEACRFVYEIVD